MSTLLIIENLKSHWLNRETPANWFCPLQINNKLGSLIYLLNSYNTSSEYGTIIFHFQLGIIFPVV